MIVIKVELHSAVTGAVTQIAEGKIWNVGDDAEDGLYSASFSARPFANASRRRLVASYAESIRHKRSDHVWELIERALSRAFP